MIWYYTVLYGIVRYGVEWYGMVWYCMLRFFYGIVLYGTVWYCTLCTVLYGMAWYGMTWHGIVLYRVTCNKYPVTEHAECLLYEYWLYLFGTILIVYVYERTWAIHDSIFGAVFYVFVRQLCQVYQELHRVWWLSIKIRESARY